MTDEDLFSKTIWFVRDLMVMIILAPVIHWLVRKTGKIFIILLGLIWFFHFIVFPNGGYPLLFSQAAFFFSFGSYIGINKINVMNFIRKGKIFPYLYVVLALADIFTRKLDYNIYIHECGILVGIISVLNVSSFLIERNIVKINMTLSNCSFFLFALHYIIMPYIGVIIFTLLHLSDRTNDMLILYFIVPVFTIFLCVLSYIFLNRFLPKVCNVLTGGR